jgi:high affinity Mn2+ porin
MKIGRENTLATAVLMMTAGILRGQSPTEDNPVAKPPETRPAWDWGFQATAITQTAPSFHDPYEGERSFRNEGSTRAATTITTTIFAAASLWKGAWVSVQPEYAAGDGVGKGQGIAAFPNLDVPSIASKPYIASAFIQQTFPLSGPSQAYEPTEQPEDKFLPGGNRYFGTRFATYRLSLTFGKIFLPDIFDINDFFGDVHHRLTNWGLNNNGAWDYAADAHGYTWGLTVALEMGSMAFRAGSYAMPTVANGPRLDAHFRQAHAENMEIEWTFDPAAQGVVRAFGYVNHARMGDYEKAITSAAGGVPDVTLTRRPERRKAGWGINAQRSLGKEWGVAARAGWNDGKTESFAYTEIDRTASVAVSRTGSLWNRPEDRAVVAVVVSGLSSVHRRYLEEGGLGFQIGDGRLRYGYETVLEGDYRASLTGHSSISLDLQYVRNPGFNQDRGPITIYGLRFHVHR